jgi:hypothetical protein
LPEANHEWTRIHLQDFKSIEDYNHAIHKVCAKLWFCEKEPSKEDKIKKTLQTMFPSDLALQHQYGVWNYQHYAGIICCSLERVLSWESVMFQIYSPGQVGDTGAWGTDQIADSREWEDGQGAATGIYLDVIVQARLYFFGGELFGGGSCYGAGEESHA